MRSMLTDCNRTYNVTITGATIHNGGSCQVSLSYDSGSTWTVIHSYVGECPVEAGDTSYDFTVPADAPKGEALFAWSWFNKIGNREMYMNCAVVTISDGGSRRRSRTEATSQVPFNRRPDMFVANIGNGCFTAEGTDVDFPEPGPDVTRNGEAAGPPTGSCAGTPSPAPA